jgi:hypothetical protein
LIVRHRFKVIGAGKEGPQFNVEARVILHQTGKLTLNPTVPSSGFAGALALKDEGLRRMKADRDTLRGLLRRASDARRATLGLWQGTDAIIQETRSSAASQVDTLSADFLHEGGLLIVRTCVIGHGAHEFTVVINDFGRDIGQAVHLRLAIPQVTQKDCDIVVGIRLRPAAHAWVVA